MVQDPEEVVGEVAGGGAVGVALLAASVVVGAGSGRVDEQGQRPEIAGVAESAVAHDAHGDRAFESAGRG